MKRFVYALALWLALGFSPMVLAADAPAPGGVSIASVEELFDRLSREFMCLCGCNQTIKNCPHVNCDFAIPARKQIRQQLENGKSHDQVVSWFITKFGEIILATPKKEGFNLVGYLLPFVALVIMVYLVSKVIARWSGARPTPPAGNKNSPAASPPAEGALAERMRRELEDFDK